MDKRDFYYLERVLESDLDQVQAFVETAIKASRSDLGEFGIHDGGDVVQNAPPDLNVLVGGPAQLSDAEGNRIAWSTQQTVDCSQDYLGSPTTVTNPANERWIAVVAEYDQTLSDPETDGNGVIVYTRVYDSFNIYVVMATEQALGTGLKASVPSDAVLLADILLVNAQTQILNADIDEDRREDYTRETGTTIADLVAGTPAAAITWLYGVLDGVASASGIVFTPSGTWHDGSALVATNVEDAINEVVADLASDTAADAGADRVGAEAHTTAGGYADLAQGSVEDQLQSVADDVDGHIGGGAPQHAASVITFSPVGIIAATDVQAAIAELLTDLAAQSAPTGAAQVGYLSPWAVGMTVNSALNLRPERDKREALTGDWISHADHPLDKTRLGGTVPPGLGLSEELPRQGFWNENWSNPFSGRNSYQLTAFNHPDVCMLWHSEEGLTGSGSTVLRPFIAVLQQIDGGGAGNYPHILIFDPEDIAGGTIADFTLSGFTGHTTGPLYGEAMCSNGGELLVCINDGAADFVGKFTIASGVGTHGWVFNFGANVYGAYPSNRIRIVNDNGDMVIALGGVATGGAGVLQCLDKNGASNWRADGDAGAAQGNPSGGLCSDGTNVYFTTDATGTATQYSLCSATIAAGADPGIVLPQNMANSRTLLDCCFDGRFVWFVTGADTIGPGAAYIGWYDPTTDAVQLPAHTIGAAGAAAIDQRHSGMCCTDGLNLWFHDFNELAAVANAISRLSAVPLGNIYDRLQPGDDPGGSCQYLKLPGNGIGAKARLGRLAFDGDAMYAIVDNGTNTNILQRVPRAGSRN